MNAPAGQVDPARCPVCGQPNACAMACAPDSASSTPCWCVSASFSPELLQRIPIQAQGKACVCRTCASGATDRR